MTVDMFRIQDYIPIYPVPLPRGGSRSSLVAGRDAVDAAASGAFDAREGFALFSRGVVTRADEALTTMLPRTAQSVWS